MKSRCTHCKNSQRDCQSWRQMAAGRIDRRRMFATPDGTSLTVLA